MLSLQVNDGTLALTHADPNSFLSGLRTVNTVYFELLTGSLYKSKIKVSLEEAMNAQSGE